MQIKWNELHQYRENNRVEAKKAVGGLPRSIWETLILGKMKIGRSRNWKNSLIPTAQFYR